MPMPDENSVFINIPYHACYESILVAIIAALISLGRTPHCTLEIPETGQGRINRIHDLLESCRVSIHELSFVGTPVRFNMPFELSLACALDRHNGPHTFILLEKQAHRLNKTLSDLRGCDPCIHNGSIRTVVYSVLEALADPNIAPATTRIHRFAIDLWRIAKELKRMHGKETIFNRILFYELVAAGTELAVNRGFIPEYDENEKP